MSKEVPSMPKNEHMLHLLLDDTKYERTERVAEILNNDLSEEEMEEKLRVLTYLKHKRSGRT